MMCSLVMAGCAGKPSVPTTYVSARGTPLAAAPMRADGTLDTQKLAEAKRAGGYSLVNENGKSLYCRTDVRVGSHVRKNTDTLCLTAQEMIDLHERTRRSLEQIVPFHMGCIPSNSKVPAPPC
jgi:hypothetical protein